jgi:drug/metabolite transporter (DMT)-like permease
LGELAAVFTSICWTFTSIIFTFAGHKVGASVLNRMRLAFAVIWILTIHLILQGRLIPIDAAPERWLWLGLSGIFGLVLGDLFLFQGFVMVGPRISTLIMALSPVMSAVFAWLLLGESLRLTQIGGILLTLSGVAWVVLERTPEAKTFVDRKRYALGLLAAFGGAAGQTAGLLMAKRGLVGDFPSVSGLAIRMLVAVAALWLVTFISGQAPSTLRSMRDRTAFWLILVGSLVGPFLGVWLSIISIQLSPVGVASTLMSLNPIFLLPFAYWLFKERVSLRAVLGTLVSVAGIVMLFLL